MIPGMDMSKMKKLLKDMEEIPADRVIIEGEKRLVIENPKVTKLNLMGQETYQILGKAVEEEAEVFSDEDVKMVMEQTGADEETVREMLIRNSGDIAKTIMDLKS